MVKYISVLLGIVLLSGCSFFKTKVKIQEVYVPLLYCPAPTKIERPDLQIHNLTPEQLKSDGEVAKAYKATVRALEGYADVLEQELTHYDDTSKKYAELRQRVKDQAHKDGIKDLPITGSTK